CADALHQLARQRPRPAAHVEHAVARLDTREIRQLRRQQRRVPPHEAVIGVCADSEAHRQTLDVRKRLNDARIARLATTDPDGRPHLVPIVFALEGDTLYSAVDRKPTRSTRLRRTENARARPDVTILVDHYEEDWSHLWWIRLRGRARVLDDGTERERARERFDAKYP